MRTFLILTVMLAVMGCNGIPMTWNVQKQMTGETVDRLFDSLQLFPTIPASILKKLSPEQITEVLKAQSNALVGINALTVSVDLSQAQGTETKTDATQSTALEAVMPVGPQ